MPLQLFFRTILIVKEHLKIIVRIADTNLKEYRYLPKTLVSSKRKESKASVFTNTGHYQPLALGS